jgi:hypothetical protein
MLSITDKIESQPYDTWQMTNALSKPHNDCFSQTGVQFPGLKIIPEVRFPLEAEGSPVLTLVRVGLSAVDTGLIV